MTKEVEEIGKDYAQWCTALDEYMRLAQGIQGPDAKIVYGRGEALKLTKVSDLKAGIVQKPSRLY